MADNYSESDLVRDINTNLNFVKSIAVEQADKCANSILSTLEYAVKLFWLKKYDKKPVWTKDYIECFDLHKAMIDKRFAQYFNEIALGDMHIIRKTCNAVMHDGASLTLEYAKELLIRLEKCVKSIESAIHMEITTLSLEDTKMEDIKQIDAIESKSSIIFFANQNKILRDFKNYLIRCGYAEYTPSGLPSTAYDYVGRIKKVLEWENISLEELNHNIDTICRDYDIGGVKQNLGEKSHRSVINALKRYREFLFTPPSFNTTIY